jgi:hypothetical protein
MNEPVLVGVTIHICHDAGEQENNFWYIEQTLERRGHGTFKHVLPARPIPLAEVERTVHDIARIIQRGQQAVIVPVNPAVEREETGGAAEPA